MKETFDIIIAIANIIILGITCYFIYRSIYSPVDAVKIGRKLNEQQSKDNAKRNLFLTLYSLRGNPIHYDFVKGLNQIDVVFEDVPTVLAAWHTHSNSLQTIDPNLAGNTWELQRTNLLSAMAVSLGYERIQQTDMIAHYYPVGHENREKHDFELREAARLYFDRQALMAQMLIQRMNDQDNGVRDSSGQQKAE